MKEIRKNSLIRRLAISLLVIYLLLFGLMLINDSFAIYHTRETICKGLCASLNIYNELIKGELQSVESYMVGLADDSMAANLRIIERNRQDVEFYTALVRQRNELDTALLTLEYVEGLFVFPTESQQFVCAYKETDATTTGKVRKIMRDVNYTGYLTELPAKRWFPVYIDNAYYLMRLYRIGTTYVGAWANLSVILSQVEYGQEIISDALFVFDGGSSYDSSASKSELQPDAVSSAADYTVYSADQRYLVLSTSASYTQNGYLAILISDSKLSDQLIQNYLLMSATGVFFLLLAFPLLYIFQRFLQRPIRRLKRSIDALRHGDFSARIHDEAEFEEFKAVNHAFNDMVGRIEKLKINVYEEQLLQQRTEMKFLKNQIAPHFLINCLNTIYHMTSIGETKKTCQMTIFLGDHLRYTLSERSTVSLDEELHMVKNYAALSNLRFSDCIVLKITADSDLLDAVVLPLMVLCFVENTIKYEVVMGKVTEIYIKVTGFSAGVSRDSEKTKKMLRITIWDTGEGWAPQTLELLQSGKMLSSEDGHHIGIKNIYQRMKFVYQGGFQIRFSNEPGAGARIDLEFPYITSFEDIDQAGGKK